MTFNEIEDQMIGGWTGENLLRLSWLTPSDFRSDSMLTATRAVGDKFLMIDYTWNHEDAAHAGLLLIGFDKEREIVNATWADSWHSSVKPLALAGKINEQGVIDLHGSFEVPNSADWLWRIVVTPATETLQIVMYNGSPEGVEDLAVQAEYRRYVN